MSSEPMTDAERIWTEITGKRPATADAIQVASIEAILTGSRRRTSVADGRDAIEALLSALRGVAEVFGLSLPGEDDCDCGGDCPCHALEAK